MTIKTLNVIILLHFLVLSPFIVFGQNATLKGKITDGQTGEGLIGATIHSRETQKGVNTNLDGEYELSLEPGQHTIQINYTGYEPTIRKVILRKGETKILNIEIGITENILNTITVTGGKYEKPLGEVVTSLEVLRADLIANSNTVTIDDGLEKVPGVSIVDGQANIRSGSGYSYGAGSRVLLLMDDIPMLQADAGFPNWRDIPVEIINQVEVLKGAASALYGSSALNGIIHVRTAYATSEPITQISTFGTLYMNPKDPVKKWWGSDSTRYDAGVSFAHRQKFGKFDLVIGGNYLKEESVEKARFSEYGRVNLGTRYRISDQLSIGLNATINTGNRGNYFFWQNAEEGAYLPSAGSDFSGDVTRITVDPFITYLDNNNNEHKLLTRFYSISNDNSDGNAVFSDWYYGKYQFQKRFDSGLILTSGLVGQLSESEGPLYGDTAYTTTNLAAFVQMEQKFFDKLNVSFGARYESNTISNPALTTQWFDIPAADVQEAKPVFRVGLNYQAKEATFIRVSWGQGYRFPTVAEKFISTQIGTGGAFSIPILQNPDLTSETGWSAEVGLKQGLKLKGWRGFIDLAAFWMEYNDMMEFNLVANPTIGFQSRNIGDTRIQGFEVSVAGQGNIGQVNTSILTGYTYANPTYQDFSPEDTLTSTVNYNVLKYRFKHTFKFDVQTEYDNLSLGVAVLYSSNMEAIDRVFDVVIQGVADYRAENNSGATIVNARLGYQMTPELKATLLCKNLFNAEYMFRPGILEPPRHISLRLDAMF